LKALLRTFSGANSGSCFSIATSRATDSARLGRGRDDISMTFDWMERPVERIMYLTGNDVGEIFAVVDVLIERK